MDDSPALLLRSKRAARSRLLVLSDSSRGRELRQSRDPDRSAPEGVTRPWRISWLHPRTSSRLPAASYVAPSAANRQSHASRCKG
jgi:hypothetical protein